jgi:hypothetical protein
MMGAHTDQTQHNNAERDTITNTDTQKTTVETYKYNTPTNVTRT